MLSTLKILWTSLGMALQELRVNKLRTFLSLLGITIGIFCIIAVFTATDSLERNVRNDVNELGSDVIYIQKWPWGGGGEYPWWKYMNRPLPDIKEQQLVQEKTHSAIATAFMFSSGGKRVEYRDDYMTGVEMIGVTQDFNRIQELQITDGRYFTNSENNAGVNVAIMGANVWEGLFASETAALGKIVRFAGRDCRIIGVLKKKGESMIGGINYDNSIILPYRFARAIVDERRYADPLILVKAKPEVTVAQLKDELRGIMRANRRLKPTQEDDFALNEITSLSGDLNSMFGAINFAGAVIAGFALIVGGFGIANIMFVTVKERTNIIGLKKAIGARRGIILLEFLLEAILLCLIGGMLGLLFVYFLTVIFTMMAGGAFQFILSMKNVILGLTISAVVGLLAGFIPAFLASKLDAVVAIRSN
jgi:putative ABC transport system permease protein